MSTRPIWLMGSGLMMRRPSNCWTRDVVVTRPWSMELRWNEVFLGTVWSWTFTDTSVNFDIHYRVFRRRLGVVSSITGVVCVCTTTTCTPSATTRPSRWTDVVERTERRRTELLVRNKVALAGRTMILCNYWALFLKIIELYLDHFLMITDNLD